MSACLSVLFLLRKFCSVAHLNFKCLAWHICLEFLFEKKTSVMKVHGIGFLFYFLRRSGNFYHILQFFSSKALEPIFKKDLKEKSFTVLCACILR